jgi:hypothetical protein
VQIVTTMHLRAGCSGASERAWWLRGTQHCPFGKMGDELGHARVGEQLDAADHQQRQQPWPPIFG